MKSSDNLLKEMSIINKSINDISKNIQNDCKNLPDIHAVNRIFNDINYIKYLQDKINIYKKIII